MNTGCDAWIEQDETNPVRCSQPVEYVVVWAIGGEPEDDGDFMEWQLCREHALFELQFKRSKAFRLVDDRLVEVTREEVEDGVR